MLRTQAVSLPACRLIPAERLIPAKPFGGIISRSGLICHPPRKLWPGKRLDDSGRSRLHWRAVQDVGAERPSCMQLLADQFHRGNPSRPPT